MAEVSRTRPTPFTALSLPVLFALLGVPGTQFAGAAQPAAERPEQPDAAPAGVTLNDAERAFSESLTGATLTGRFTVDGDATAPKEERYEIVAATKVGEDDWVIVARIQYGPNDVRVPVPVKIHWAGDTPILSLTDLAIPGLGTFTSRVMFYEGRYAGTWQHGDKGGHLFGTYEKPKANPEQPKPVSPDE